MDVSDQLINHLINPCIYEHGVDNVTVIETHLSWVLLTGYYAYKIKKPIQFSFVDFSTLEKRKFYCDEELRLNSRLAPNLYLDVVAITGSSVNPSFKQSGVPIEYAVKMRQFSQHLMLSYLSENNLLQHDHIDDLAIQVANFHMNIDRISVDGMLGAPEDIQHWTIDSFEQIESKIEDKKYESLINRIKLWSTSEYQKIYNRLQQRRDCGFVRECHGDMHLQNMVLIDEKVTIFDGIEFNKHLRWIDVISEISFLAMDLHERKHPDLAYRFVNLYLQHTGDYEGMFIFRYYFVYRAIVRAKVALIRLSQNSITKEQERESRKQFISYIELALTYSKDKKAALIITQGLSGSGKSTYAELLVESIGAIQIRSDIERKRLFQYSALEDTGSDVDKGIYSQESFRATYQRLADLTKFILESGYSVIVDACFLQECQREKFRALASVMRVPFIILEFHANTNTLKKRIIARSQQCNDPSEANIEVLNQQLKIKEPLDEEEKKNAIVINTENEVHIAEISKIIKDQVITG